MKKYILIIIFLFGLMLSFYSGYNTDISTNQIEVFSNESKKGNYEFFLKFNQYYDSQVEFVNDNIMVNKIMIETTGKDYLGYNFIIKNVNEVYLQDDTSVLTLTITGSEGKHEIQTTVKSYNYFSLFNTQVTKEVVEDKCGEEITNIKFSNEEETIFNLSTNVDTNQLTTDYITNQETGFTQEEIKELIKIKNYKNTLSQIGLFSIAYVSITALFIGGLWIYKNKM